MPSGTLKPPIGSECWIGLKPAARRSGMSAAGGGALLAPGRTTSKQLDRKAEVDRVAAVMPSGTVDSGVAMLGRNTCSRFAGPRRPRRRPHPFAGFSSAYRAWLQPCLQDEFRGPIRVGALPRYRLNSGGMTSARLTSTQVAPWSRAAPPMSSCRHALSPKPGTAPSLLLLTRGVLRLAGRRLHGAPHHWVHVVCMSSPSGHRWLRDA
jgi:hypothetical protein